ncbi:bacterial pre-peptidase, partial [Candidatus Thiomargarita nelsonii]
QVSGNLTDSGSAQWSTGQYFNAYQFEAEPGQAISIVMRSQQFNTYLWLLDNQGKVITVNDDKREQTASEIIFFPFTSGNYFIAASSSLPMEKGGYELILKTTHQPTQAKVLSGTVSEKLETADFQLSTGQYLDVYTFQGEMDERVSIGLSSSEFDSYLRIMDSAGNVLRQDDDSAGDEDA